MNEYDGMSDEYNDEYDDEYNDEYKDEYRAPLAPLFPNPLFYTTITANGKLLYFLP